MLWKDFAQEECCDGCPLLENEICPGGFVCYGGQPIEPPCCCFDDNTDLDDWVNDYFEQKKRREELEESRLKKEQKKRERARKAAETRRAVRLYCFSEIKTLKQAEKELKAQLAAERFAVSLVEAINTTNEMFRYKERVSVNPETSDEIKRLEAEVLIAKGKYDAKRKEFYTNRRIGRNDGKTD